MKLTISKMVMKFLYLLKKEFNDFWRVIELSNELKSAIQIFSKEVVVSQDNIKNEDRPYFNYPRRSNSFSSPNFFYNRYIEMFCYTHFILEQSGICFAAFLFLQFIIQIVVTIIRSPQLQKTT